MTSASGNIGRGLERKRIPLRDSASLLNLSELRGRRPPLKKGSPYRVKSETLGFDYADAFAAMGRGDNRPSKRGARFDDELVLQSVSDAEQSDQEQRNAAYEMSQRWGKLRSIKWKSLTIESSSKTCEFLARVF